MVFFLVFGISVVAFLLVIGGMAIGVLMGRREISGSCGGLANQSEGETSCSLCSNPDAACKELRNRMSTGDSTAVEPETIPHDQEESVQACGVSECGNGS